MTISECIHSGREVLAEAAIQCADPLLHMKQIVQHVLNVNTKTLYLRWNDPIPEESVKVVDQLVAQRAKGEPFQYLVGVEWFWDFPFKVGPGVLIPRPDTEMLIEVALKEFPEKGVKIAELGAGSGIIGITLLKERPAWEWEAYEIDKAAAAYAKTNAEALLGSDTSYRLHERDFFDGVALRAPYDGLVANPPYIAESELESLPKEVKHEPRVALIGGPEGTEVFGRMARVAVEVLKPGGKLISEIDCRSVERVKELLKEAGFDPVWIIADYNRQPRVVVARKP